MNALPRVRVPRVQPSTPVLWDTMPVLSAFVLADGMHHARQQTSARLWHDGASLHVRFDCEDRDIWGTYTRRDDPIYEEEAVELFLAPGEADPVEYFEFEVSPQGVLFDARITNPTSRRAEMTVDAAWDCAAIAWRAGADRAAARWWAELSIPWRSLIEQASLPEIWRANLYRIERPRGSEPELSCWSPTFTEPADFHRPRSFGFLEIER